MKIEWEYPEPRKWAIGDKLLGPGYTRAELALTLLTGLGCAIAALVLALRDEGDFSWWQLAMVGIVAFDLGGGIPANATGCAKRWWFRPGQGFWAHFRFNAAHVHPFLFAWVFHQVSWAYAGFVWGTVVVGTLAVLLAPKYLQRPLGLSVVAGALALQMLLDGPPMTFAWLAPVLWLKLIASHAVYDAPSRP
jgi:hypothetical protein